ncbi:MAG: HAMP domain-containing protein [Nitriliruptor sp.]|nr:MAG: HAMP domain-containing protein [Nitriliruptor sp.]
MSARAPRRRLVRRLFLGQLMVILVGAGTLGAVAFLVAPPIFHDHIRRAVGPVSDVVAHHLDQALSETLLLALTIGILAAAAAATGVSWLLATRIALPVEELSRTADALAAGRLGERAPHPSAEDELADLTDAFNGMADVLEHTETTRRRLLADLAHELRTPLATIEAYHEGLADGVVEADADTVATLQDATGRLQRLVEDLSLVSSAEEGRLTYDLRPIELAELVGAAVDAVAPAARERGLHLETRTPGVPVIVEGDRDRLAQVLANLLRNALEHTSDDGSITASVTSTPDQAIVVISDTGVGIAPEHLPHVFERFFRADPSRRHVTGSGIGLTISRAIVQGHGGELTAHSDGPDTGASFTMRLPAATGP